MRLRLRWWLVLAVPVVACGSAAQHVVVLQPSPDAGDAGAVGDAGGTGDAGATGEDGGRDGGPDAGCSGAPGSCSFGAPAACAGDTSSAADFDLWYWSAAIDGLSDGLDAGGSWGAFNDATLTLDGGALVVTMGADSAKANTYGGIQVLPFPLAGGEQVELEIYLGGGTNTLLGAATGAAASPFGGGGAGQRTVSLTVADGGDLLAILWLGTGVPGDTFALCSAGLRTVHAGCTPETDGAFCAGQGKNCGTLSGTDNCGQARTASCGACSGTCVGNVCNLQGSPACTAYVSPSGTLNGQAASTTIQAGVDALAAGDTLCVGPGTYHEQVTVTTPGTPSQPITIQSFDPSNKAVIDGEYTLPTGNTGYAGCTQTNVDRVAYPEYACDNLDLLVKILASNVVWNGIDVIHSLGEGVFLGDGSQSPLGWIGNASPSWSVTNLQFLNSTVQHIRGMGVFIFYADTVVFSGNDVSDTNNFAPYDDRTSPGGTFLAWGNGLNVVGRNVTVTNNVFHQQFCEPVSLGNFVLQTPSESSYYDSVAFRSVENIDLEQNVFYDNWAMEGPYVGNVDGGTISGNLIYSSGDSTYFRSGVPQTCLSVDSETGNGSTHVEFANNILSNCYVLISLQQFYANSTYSDLSFDFNTLFNPYPGGDVIENSMTQLTGLSFFDNLSYAPGLNMSSTQYSQGQGGAVNGNFNAVPGLSSGYNLWSSAPSTNLSGAHDLVLATPGLSVPAYVPSASAPATFDVNAIDLTAGSPALDAGLAIPAVTDDYFGTPRPASGPSIGAYQ